MKIKNFAFKTLGQLMVVILAIGMLSSCKKGSNAEKIAEVIPADAIMVMKINAEQILQSSGCSVDNGKIVLSEKYKNAIKQNAGATAVNMVESYLAKTEGIDLSTIIFFTTSFNSENGAAVVAPLLNVDAVKKNLTDIAGKSNEEDGFEVYKLDDFVLAVKDDMLWGAPKLSAIQKQIESAKEGNIASVTPVAELLDADNAFAFVINLPAVKSQGGNLQKELEREDVPTSLAKKIGNVMNYFACFSATLSGNTLSGEFYLVDKDGKRNEFGKVLNVINTDFLQNIPADVNTVGACGDIADPDVKKLLQEVADELNRYDQQSAAFTPLFTDLNGTLAAGIDCNAIINTRLTKLLSMSDSEMGYFILQNMKFSAMAHYPENVITSITGLLVDQISNNGGQVEGMANNYYSVAIPGTDTQLYFGNANGYLNFANFTSSKNATNLANKFAGKRMMIYSTANANPDLADCGWDFGSESELWLETDAVKFKTTLIGTKANFLQAFLEPLTDMANISNLMELANTIESAQRSRYYSYYYDDDDDILVEPQEDVFEDYEYSYY